MRAGGWRHRVDFCGEDRLLGVHSFLWLVRIPDRGAFAAGGAPFFKLGHECMHVVDHLT